MTESSRYLDGIVVITIAQNVPGPLAAARLAAAGARVIKIEPPTGDPFLALSPAWHAELHRNVAIEQLDLKSDDGRARFLELVRDADVLITSHRPSALQRLAIDPASLRGAAPRLRHIHIVGSLSDPEEAGHDLTYQAHVGLVGDTMPRVLAADVMGSERVFAAALALLRQPPGSLADIGLVDSLDSLAASYRHGLTRPDGVLGGGTHRYRLYETRNGRVAVAALEPHFERRLYEALSLPIGTDATDTFLDRTAAEWERWARERDLPIVQVR